MADTLEKEWSSYFVQLTEVERKSVLLMLKAFIKGRGQEPERISLEQYNKEIDEALAEIENGNFISQEEMEKQAATW